MNRDLARLPRPPHKVWKTHLLRPKAGDVAFVLDAMGEGLHVTIVYAQGAGSMMDIIAGRVRDIRVHIRQRAIDPSLRGDYENDAAFRARFQAWVNALWAEKDREVDQLLGA